MRDTGAGVILYATQKDKIYLLLGREKETYGWKQGSHRWSAFSGKLEKHEKPIRAAAREFLEETCCAVPIESKLHKTEESLMQVLYKNAQHIKLQSCVQNEELTYHLFMLKSIFKPYDRAFSEARESLSRLDVFCREYARLRRISNTIPFVFLPGYRLSSSLIVVNVSVASNSAIVTLFDTGGSVSQCFNIAYEVDSCDCEKLQQIDLAWSNIQTSIEELKCKGLIEHPALKITRAGPYTVNAWVNKNYLEKCEIAWWDLEELMQIYKNCKENQIDDERFRAMFIKNLKQISDSIKQRIKK